MWVYRRVLDGINDDVRTINYLNKCIINAEIRWMAKKRKPNDVEVRLARLEVRLKEAIRKHNAYL